MKFTVKHITGLEVVIDSPNNPDESFKVIPITDERYDKYISEVLTRDFETYSGYYGHIQKYPMTTPRDLAYILSQSEVFTDKQIPNIEPKSYTDNTKT